jgi:hypothetical protein
MIVADGLNADFAIESKKASMDVYSEKNNGIVTIAIIFLFLQMYVKVSAPKPQIKKNATYDATR